MPLMLSLLRKSELSFRMPFMAKKPSSVAKVTRALVISKMGQMAFHSYLTNFPNM